MTDRTLKVEATGYGDSKRIVDQDGNLVAMVAKYANGFWKVHDRDTNKALSGHLKTPVAARKWVENNL